MAHVFLLTYHCASNVGAMLQCYALSTTIEQLGHRPTVIDFRPSKIISSSVDHLFWRKKRKNNYINFREQIQYCKRFLKYAWSKKRHHLIFKGNTDSAFCDFMTQKLHLTDNVYYYYKELESFSQAEGIFIVGSDQVWNPVLSDVPQAYLLDFVKNGKKNAYAASFGTHKTSEDFSLQLKKSLDSFQIISVREDSGVEIVKNIVNRKATCVLDPVFLLDKETWSRLVYRVPINEPYIFVYRMEDNECFPHQIDKLRGKNPKLKVVQFDYIRGGITPDYVIQRKGPVDFISYLFSSSYVVTNSFHGTAFSIIANKQAIVIPHSRYNDRIESLMKKMGVVKNDDGIYRIEGHEKDYLKGNIATSLEVVRNICSE